VDPAVVLAVIWFLWLVVLACWTRDAEVIGSVVAIVMLLVMGIIASRQGDRSPPSRKRRTRKRAMQIENDAVAKYDHQPRPHHGCCDPVRAFLAAEAEVAHRESAFQKFRRWASEPSKHGGNMNNGEYVVVIALGITVYIVVPFILPLVLHFLRV
jgi:hypothetical protein